MTLRHISPRSIDWMDAMDEGAGGRGWEKLAPEERTKLREVEYASEYASAWAKQGQESKQEPTEGREDDDYGGVAVSASR